MLSSEHLENGGSESWKR